MGLEDVLSYLPRTRQILDALTPYDGTIYKQEGRGRWGVYCDKKIGTLTATSDGTGQPFLILTLSIDGRDIQETIEFELD